MPSVYAASVVFRWYSLVKEPRPRAPSALGSRARPRCMETEQWRHPSFSACAVRCTKRKRKKWLDSFPFLQVFGVFGYFGFSSSSFSRKGILIQGRAKLDKGCGSRAVAAVMWVSTLWAYFQKLKSKRRRRAMNRTMESSR